MLSSITNACTFASELPPVLLMHGDNDVVTPLAETQIFFTRTCSMLAMIASFVCTRMRGHGFFNWNEKAQITIFSDTLRDMDQFLVDHGYLSGSEEHVDAFSLQWRI